MAYQSNAPVGKPYEQKPRTGSMFKNDDFDPNGDLDDSNNYWGNGKIMETDGTVLNFRVYAKVAKESGKNYWKLSMYEPLQQGQQGQQGYQGKQGQQGKPDQPPPVDKDPWD